MAQDPDKAKDYFALLAGGSRRKRKPSVIEKPAVLSDETKAYVQQILDSPPAMLNPFNLEMPEITKKELPTLAKLRDTLGFLSAENIDEWYQGMRSNPLLFHPSVPTHSDQEKMKLYAKQALGEAIGELAQETLFLPKPAAERLRLTQKSYPPEDTELLKKLYVKASHASAGVAAVLEAMAEGNVIDISSDAKAFPSYSPPNFQLLAPPKGVIPPKGSGFSQSPGGES